MEPAYRALRPVPPFYTWLALGKRGLLGCQVPNMELPFYFDQRGEINREMAEVGIRGVR